MRSIPRRLLAPRQATHAPGRRAGTLQCGGGGGGAEGLHDGIVDEGGDLGGGGHPAGEEGFLGVHVDGAGEIGFAGEFEGDAIGEEDFDRAGEELLDTIFPDGAAVSLESVSVWLRGGGRRWATNVVVHGGGAEEEDACVVGEGHFVDLGAVILLVSAIVDVVVLVEESDAAHPFPGLRRVLGIRLVLGVQRETRANVEEAAVGDRVLVAVPVEVTVRLPM